MRDRSHAIPIHTPLPRRAHRFEPSEGVYLYLLGLVVVATHPGRFWLGFTLAVVPLVIGPVGRASGGAPGATSQHLVLAQAQPGDLTTRLEPDAGLKMFRHLHQRTGGEIGVLVDLLRKAANRAINDRSERITGELLSMVKISGKEPAQATRRRTSALVTTQPSGIAARRLPMRVRPVPGESLPSYIDRMASAYGASRGSMISRLGMRTGARLQVGYGVDLDPTAREALMTAADLSEAQVHSMLLPRYSSVLGLEDYSLSSPARQRGQILGRSWVYRSGSHFCPACLKPDKGAWQVAWRLPWSTLCTRHRIMLVDMCPHCGMRAASLSPRTQAAPAARSHIRAAAAARWVGLEAPHRRSAMGH